MSFFSFHDLVSVNTFDEGSDSYTGNYVKSEDVKHVFYY